MGTELSSNNNNTPPSSSMSADSFVGSFISVTSKSEIRYEGVLYYLNPIDSTFGLKDVRSYGTEGRRNNEQEVPPSDKVYEYILFRGSDIKDLKVITNSTLQKEEPIYNDPAIIQSNYHTVTSSSSKSMPNIGRSLTESSLYSEPSASNAKSYSSILPSHHSGSQLGLWGSSQLTQTAAPSYGMPTQWPGYSGASGNIVGTQQHSLLSTPTLYPFQNQAVTTMAATNISHNVPLRHSLATPSSFCLNATPTLTSEQLALPSVDSLSSNPSQTLHHSTLINSNGLTLPFSLPYQNKSSIEAQVVNKVVPDPVPSLPVQLLPYSTSSVSHPVSDSSIRQQVQLTPNLSQPILSEHSLSKNVYPDQKDMDARSSVPQKFSSPATTPAAQPPLLPLPPASQKLQPPLEFNEEFDFQEMNEKFKKDEVWGYLGKSNQRENVEWTQNAASSEDSGDNNPDLVSNNDPKPAYNKDDFFDTISCNSLGRGARDGQNRLSERMKLDSETFGNFQRTQFAYGNRGGRGPQRNPYSWGRGYNYGNRGRGRYM
ncbi:hypothetical protein ACS0TY_011965 [Phlomoides rotata]